MNQWAEHAQLIPFEEAEVVAIAFGAILLWTALCWLGVRAFYRSSVRHNVDLGRNQTPWNIPRTERVERTRRDLDQQRHTYEAIDALSPLVVAVTGFGVVLVVIGVLTIIF